ncbi:hypothetical protein GCM10011374_40740 [Kocuria dechangensis]|uniref:Endonuclease/exonuclease/phosphatase family protein n=1 Tax=Kocuria dechangensis TaxID=1176249 RepID=A0A917H9E0_9MICC|nr:endonuclease/exonuclease/phosphatase family protein [Kocuria dechangensis]GGG71854.1 hypothetical protein GCM10011374_40740 [Kocuria dechangensis]
MRTPRVPALLSTAVAVVLAGTALTPAAAAAPETAPAGGPESSSLLQLNLCLSGVAGCYPNTEYPAVVEEAITTIGTHAPDAVTVNEACSGNIARIAEETGYDYRFTTVIYRGAPLECTDPTGRGVYGNAVLTDGTITGTEEGAFGAQLGSEERRWLCVQDDEAVRACTAHLSVAGSPAQAATNDAQCQELTAILGRDGQSQATIFAGDVNRQQPCAPAGFWATSDAAAAQAPGIQHAYGSRAWLLAPRTEIVPMTYTDHHGLLTHARLRPAAA